MTFKKKNTIKIIRGFGLFSIAGIIFAFNSSREMQAVPESKETILPLESNDSIETSLQLRDSVEQFGQAFLGVPYVYGGTSKSGFDCSGFVYYVYDEFGIKVPRSSSQFADFGKEVPIDSVKKGDILVFLSPTRNAIGHVGIVTHPNGMETEFIHASSSREMQVTISSLKQPGYQRRFVKAISVLGD